MNRTKLILLGAGCLLLWSAINSGIFIGIDALFHGHLYQLYPPPSLFWQWWHYALFGSDNVWTTKLLVISAAPGTLLFVAGGLRAVTRPKPAPPLYGESAWAGREEVSDSGFSLRKKR